MFYRLPTGDSLPRALHGTRYMGSFSNPHFTPGTTHLLLLSALKFSHCDGMQWYLLRNSLALLWSIRCFGDHLSPMSDANELHTHI